jgi:hypothetical protein
MLVLSLMLSELLLLRGVLIVWEHKALSAELANWFKDLGEG